MRRIILVAFIFLALAWFRPLFLQAADFPQPRGYVSDFGEMLSPSLVQELETDLSNFEKETMVEIAVVTIETLGEMTVEEYAVRLFEDWGIGKKDQDNGLLVLVAKKERKMRLEVGYGLEPVITDGRAGRIIREQMTPAFKKENYDQGIKAAIDEIKNFILTGQPPMGEEVLKEKAVSSFPLIILAFILLIYFSSFWGRSKQWWPGGVVGGLEGAFVGWLSGGNFLWSILGFAFLGLLLDYLLSQNYQKLKASGRPTGFFKSWGGFSSGGGGGFGGFGGGRSGGGGASGGW